MCAPMTGLNASAHRAVAPVTPYGSYAHYIGRVGALAVALGIGMAVSTGYGISPGVAWAQDGSGSNEGSGSTDGQSDNPSDGQSPGAGDLGGTTPPSGSDKSGAEPSNSNNPSGGTGGMNVGSSGGVDNSHNDTGQGTDTNVDITASEQPTSTPTPTAAPTPSPAPKPLDLVKATWDSVVGAFHLNGASGAPQGQAPQNNSTAVVQTNTPAALVGGASGGASGSSNTIGSTGTHTVVPMAAQNSFTAPVNAAGNQRLFSAQGDESASNSLTTLNTTASQAPALPDTISTLVTSLVSALLSPFVSTGPNAPAEPPLLWALLGFVRREFFNGTPDATNDSVNTLEDTSLTFNPRVNDVDADGDPLAITGVTQALHGTVTKNADGTVTYTPNANYNGADSFTYTVTDESSTDGHIHGLGGFLSGLLGGDAGHTDTATVNVTVGAVNDAPVADDDTYSATEDTPLVVNAATGVLNGDTDTEGSSLSVTGSTDPAHGSVTVNPDGSFTYTPDANFAGADTFNYTVSDGTATDTGLVTINVGAVEDDPVAADDSYEVAEDGTLNVPVPGVLGNDSDPDAGQTISVVDYTQPANGSVTLNPNGSFTYTPDPDFNGPDSFTYKISDGAGPTGTATVNITVTAVNDAPVAGDDEYTVAEDSGQTGHFGLMTNDTDADIATNADELVTVGTGPTATEHGTMQMYSDGSFTYTPNPDFNGDDHFTYTVKDLAGATDTATVTVHVTPVNDAPTVSTSPGATTYTENDANTPVAVDPGLTLTDPDSPTMAGALVGINGGAQAGDKLSYTPPAGSNITIDAANSTDTFLVLTGAGSAADYQAALRNVTFTSPGDNPVGGDRTVGFAVYDDHGVPTGAFKTVTVVAVNDAPTVSTSPGATTYTENDANTPVAVDPGLTLTDPDSPTMAGCHRRHQRRGPGRTS